MVIDTAAVNQAQRYPQRKNVPEIHMTELGRTALRRAHLEAERRWCGKKTMIVDNGSELITSEPERIAILFYLRTLKAYGFLMLILQLQRSCLKMLISALAIGRCDTKSRKKEARLNNVRVHNLGLHCQKITINSRHWTVDLISMTQCSAIALMQRIALRLS